MRALSVRQASRCETAFGNTCHCRCGGQFHGARRVLEPDRELFEQLPEDDPHRVPSAEEKKRHAKMARVAAKTRGQGLLFPLFEEVS